MQRRRAAVGRRQALDERRRRDRDEAARPQQPEAARALADEVRRGLEPRAVGDAARGHEPDLGRPARTSAASSATSRALSSSSQRIARPARSSPRAARARAPPAAARAAPRAARTRRQRRVERARELRDAGLRGDLVGDGGEVGEAEFEGAVHAGLVRHGAGALEDSLRPVTDSLLDELCAWLRIPSISSGGGDPADLERAAGWAAERVLAAGGSAEVVSGYGNPLCVGELRARRADAPTVLIYGHYDVQSPDPRELWTSDPFEPVVRDGRLYARGASDDKGNFLPLLHVACELARAGELPVHVRVVLEGEEEIGGTNVLRFLDQDERGADCAIVFDGGMIDEARPAMHIAVRGIVTPTCACARPSATSTRASTAASALNAAHALAQMLAPVLPGPDGRLRDELRAGLRDAEPRGDRVLGRAARGRRRARRGRRDRDRPGRRRRAVRAHLGGREPRRQRHRERRRAAAPHDHPVHGQRARQRPHRARAERRGRGGVARAHPARRDARRAPRSSSTIDASEPAGFDPADPVLGLAREAIGRAAGSLPLLVRTGGSIPILAALAQRGIPTVLSGFALDSDGIHGPDESYRLESLALGEQAARELYAALGDAQLAGSGIGGERRLHALARDQLDAVGGRLRSSAPDPRRARTARAPSRRGRGGRPARWRPMPQRTRAKSRVPSRSATERSPLWPPSPPPSLARTCPNAASTSSCTHTDLLRPQAVGAHRLLHRAAREVHEPERAQQRDRRAVLEPHLAERAAVLLALGRRRPARGQHRPRRGSRRCAACSA